MFFSSFFPAGIYLPGIFFAKMKKIDINYYCVIAEIG